MKKTAYIRLLNMQNRIRNEFESERGHVFRFVVQLETWIDEVWYPVVRYDTAHGFAHKDLLTPSGRQQKTFLSGMSFNEALTFAQHDIQMNWQKYLTQFLEEFEK